MAIAAWHQAAVPKNVGFVTGTLSLGMSFLPFLSLQITSNYHQITHFHQGSSALKTARTVRRQRRVAELICQ